MIISYQAISFSHVAYVINKISSRAQHMNQPEQEEKHTHTNKLLLWFSLQAFSRFFRYVCALFSPAEL